MSFVPVALADVAAALGVTDHECIALVGGGGKTTLLHAIGSQLPGRVVLTTTTKMGAGQHRSRALLVSPTDVEIAAITPGAAPLVVARIEGHKAVGVSPADCDRWFALVDHVVIEADGSRHRPFKAPRPFEPVVPSTCTVLVSLIGADALGRVIADQCHRPLRVAALAGCSPYVRLSPAAAARVLLHQRGARAAAPPPARLAVVITKVDDRNVDAVEELADELERAEPGVDVIAVATTNPVG